MTNGPTRSSDERLDTEIRRAVSELVDLAPLPPTLDPACIQTARRPRRALVGTILLFALVTGLTALAIWVVPKPDHQAQQPQDPLPGPTTTQVPPTPTLVGPSTPPRGLELVLGGTVTLTGGADALLLANGTGTKTARLIFTAPTGRAGCTTGQQVTTTTHAAGPSKGPPATQGAQPSLAEARWQSPGDGFGALHWCDDAGRELNLVTRGLTQTQARELASTVRASPTDPAAVDVDPPEGFVLGRELRSTRTSRLLYERAGSPSPRLEVTVQTPWTRHLQLLAATAWSAELLQLDGRPSIALSHRPGKGFDTYVVLWDDTTLVTVRGDGLTDQQLRAAAADLRPLDPSLAPENPNPLTCDRLGLCG